MIKILTLAIIVLPCVSYAEKLTIDKVTPTLYLDKTQTEARLYLEIDEPQKVKSATVEIRSPSYSYIPEESSEINFQTFSLDNQKNCLDNQKNCKRFETVYNGFQQAGQYDIIYTLHSDDNVYPVYENSVVYKNKANNHPPNPFHLASPVDKEETQTILIFDWESTDDPDGDPITYIFTIADNESFKEFVYQKEQLDASMTYVDDNVKLKDLGGLRPKSYFHWKVEAVDQFGAKTTSDIRTFTTNNPGAPPGIASIRVYNALDYRPLGEVGITIDIPQQPNIFEDPNWGSYYFLLLQGYHNITLNLLGYRTGYRKRTVRTNTSIDIKITSGQSKEIDIALTPYTFFSSKTGILEIAVVTVSDSGDFSASLRLEPDSEPLIFTLMDDVTPIFGAREDIATFSFETGQLSIPNVTLIDDAGTEIQYQATMKLVPDSESLQFKLIDAVRH